MTIFIDITCRKMSYAVVLLEDPTTVKPGSRILRAAQALALIRLLKSVLLEPDRLDGDEAGGISGLKVLQRVHRRLFGGIQLLRAARSAQHVGVALVAAQSDLAVDALYR